MDTPLIEMDKDVAKEKQNALRKLLRSKAAARLNAEVKRDYEAAEAGYKALAKGSRLIDITEAFAHCPFDEKGRPKLCIGRADREVIHFNWQNNTSGRFRPENTSRYTPTDTRLITLPEAPAQAYYGHNKEWGPWRYDGYSIVPRVPADVRPATGTEKDWFVLWEVEKWQDNARGSTPDRDPYLLKHLGGSLYQVLAEWDLTDLEIAIMKRSSITV